MTRPVRLLLILGAAISLFALALAIAAAVWLSSWVPTKGKAWLEAEIEQQGPLEVDIGRLRYSLWEGLLCEDVAITDRRTRTRWVQAPLIRIHVGLPALAANRTADFRINANLEVPARTSLTLTGRYELRDRRGLFNISTQSLLFQTLVIEDLSGTFHLSDEMLTIERLDGRTLGASWQLEGTLGPLAAPVIDVRGRTQVDLAALPQWLPQAAAWRPGGAAQTVFIARGPLSRWPLIELMADTEVSGASVSVPFPAFPHRLDRITGRIRYDHLTREAQIVSLAGRALEHDVSAQGSVLVSSPPLLDLTLKTEGDLAALQALLPEGHAVESAKGQARIQVALEGPATQPAWKGQAQVSDARIALRGMADALEGLQGTITFSQQEIRTSDLRLRLRDIPLDVEAALTDMQALPRLAGTATFPQGSLTLDARLKPDGVELQANGTVELAEFARDLQGRVTFQSQARGDLRQWRDIEMLGTASSPRVVIRGLPAHGASLQWQQSAGVLMIKLVQAQVAGGRVAATWFAELHTQPVKLVADADVTSIDLSQLATTLPAWRARDIRGMASSHAELSGFPRDQAGWRGTGWVNMAGEHLGEVPLLDRVFQGVFGALADRLGLVDLRRAKLTKVSGQWRLTQGRIFTDNLQLSGSAGAEPLTIMIKGSIGLDKTLDLTVEPNLSEQLVLAAPNTSSLSRTILQVVGGAERMRQMVGRHHVGGTIEKPEYKFEFNLEQLLNQVLPSGFGQFLEGVR